MSAEADASQGPAESIAPQPPLAGTRVVEVANYVTGPYAGVLLADLGADVVKVEERDRGDPFRGWGEDGYSPTFRALNRGKRSVGLDLATAEGRSVLSDLAARADVVIENFRPGVAERLGFGYEAIRARNPRVIYCAISGFGETGPYRDRPGYDSVGQAMSGLLGLLTDLDDPSPMGISLSDHLTGVFACYGILAGLLGRAATGEGRLVKTSLLQATTAFVAENAARYLHDGVVPNRAARTHLAQAYAFVAGDGKPFVVHLSSPPKFWEGLTDGIGRPELRADPRFADRVGRIRHYEELRSVLADTFASGPRHEWLRKLDERDVPAAPIYQMDEVFADPGVQALGLVQTMVHPVAGTSRLVGSGVTISGNGSPGTQLAPPLLGEHTVTVLRELGRDDAAIGRLREQGVI